MAANGPYSVAIFQGEVVKIQIDMDTSIPSLAGTALRFELYTPDAIAVSYTNGPNLTVDTVTNSATILLPTRTAGTGSTALPSARYDWEIRRMDTASEAVLAYGELNLKNARY